MRASHRCGVRWPVLGLARRITYVVSSDGRIAKVFRSELDADAHVREACDFVASR